MNLTTTLCLVLTAGFLAFEVEKAKPKPYPLGSGDTLMVRIVGYGFCPEYCEIDHFHIGHFKGYDCEDFPCNHITINNEEWFRKTYNVYMDVYYDIFCLWNVGGCKSDDWYNLCIHKHGNGAH